MISPITATPDMTFAQMVNLVNSNFRQLESQSITKTVKDKDGNNRIIEGRFPDGDYGIIISVEGYNVQDLFVSQET